MIIFYNQKRLSLNFKSSCSQKLFKIGVFIEKIDHRCFFANIAKYLRKFFCKHLRTAASALIITYYNNKLSNQVLGIYWQKHNVEWFLLRRLLDLVRDIRILTGLDRFCSLFNVYSRYLKKKKSTRDIQRPVFQGGKKSKA